MPDQFVYLFQEGDRCYFALDEASGEGEEGKEDGVGYIAGRQVILDRLDLAGCTAECARDAFGDWLAKQREAFRGYIEGGGDWAKQTLEALEDLTYGTWKERAREVLLTRYDFTRPRDEFCDELDRNMRNLSGEWLFFADEYLVSLRALLDAMPEVREVSLDISPLIDGGWIGPDEPICELRRQPSAYPRSVLEPTVIIAEGSTDILVLRRSLARLYPHLADYITFFDYDGSNSDAGASYVIKFLKAFAAARINTSILAIFDNDAAGHDALNAALSLALPANFRVVCLPDLKLARSYPTIGPQGVHDIDVNGSAVGIELFTGRHNLTNADGALIPIVWAGYVRGVGRYQGALQEKSRPLARFLRETEQHREDVDYQRLYPELRELWEMIFCLIRRSNRPESRRGAAE